MRKRDAPNVMMKSLKEVANFITRFSMELLQDQHSCLKRPEKQSFIL
jgi:hypothetical protein